MSALQQTTHYNITFRINKHWSSSAGLCPRPRACPFPQPCSDTHLGKIELELLAVELGLMQLDPSAGSGLWGAEVDPDSPEAFEHLESCLLVVDPKQSLEPLLWGGKNMLMWGLKMNTDTGLHNVNCLLWIFRGNNNTNGFKIGESINYTLLTNSKKSYISQKSPKTQRMIYITGNLIYLL